MNEHLVPIRTVGYYFRTQEDAAYAVVREISDMNEDSSDLLALEVRNILEHECDIREAIGLMADASIRPRSHLRR